MPSFWERLKQGMTRTRSGFGDRLHSLLHGHLWKEELWDELEEILYSADLGSATTEFLLDALRRQVQLRRPATADEVINLLSALMQDELGGVPGGLTLPEGGPWVWLMVGVNGTGKTTTAGKFAYLLRRQNRSVILGAADTFRAAAAEQLEVWGRRAGSDVIRQAPGADPAAVAFDTVQAAKARHLDLAIIDTAGRLQNKVNLMQELQKVHRVIGRELEGAPHEVSHQVNRPTHHPIMSRERLIPIRDGTGSNRVQRQKSGPS